MEIHVEISPIAIFSLCVLKSKIVVFIYTVISPITASNKVG